MDYKNTRITRVIHWTMTLLITLLLTMGFYMKNTESYQFYALHKSLGVIALVAILIRLYWRFKQPWQSHSQNQPLEKAVTAAHMGLLGFMLLMPISGLMLSGLGGHGVALFGMSIIPGNHNAAGEAQPYHQALAELGYISHEIMGYLFAGLVILHILAALKHHLIDKDATLLRMLGKDVS